MTDLEMTKLCAEALAKVTGMKFVIDGGVYVPKWRGYFHPLGYEPHAFRLVEELKLCVVWALSRWHVSPPRGVKNISKHEDLKRAIVECVARMQSGKANQ